MIDFQYKKKTTLAKITDSEIPELTQNNNFPNCCPSKGSFCCNQFRYKKEMLPMILGKQHLETIFNAANYYMSQNQPARNTVFRTTLFHQPAITNIRATPITFLFSLQQSFLGFKICQDPQMAKREQGWKINLFFSERGCFLCKINNVQNLANFE